MFLKDHAKAFDNWQNDFVAQNASFWPALVTEPQILAQSSQGHILYGGGELLTLFPYRNVNWPGMEMNLLTVPFPGEPQPLGVMVIDLDANTRHLLPHIRAQLEALASTQTKVFTGDILPWVKERVSLRLESPDYAFFTTPFAGINPEIQRRERRAGWPDLPMATDLSFAPNLQVCATLSVPGPGLSNCGFLEKLETNHLEVSILTSYMLLTRTLETRIFWGTPWTWGMVWPTRWLSPPDGATITAGTVETVDLQANTITGADAAITALTSQQLTISSAPPAGGFRYAASLGNLNTGTVRTPVLAAKDLVSLPATARTPILSADFLERRTNGGQPSLSFGTLTASTASMTAAALQSLIVQERCTGCE